jgi:isopentenyldiphosphate isomerase
VVSQNDPHEVLEVFDASGRATGIARSRAAIHLNGDWHKAFHCWILRHGGQEVVLQRRSLLKDTYPGCWDAAAAGHWRFGESAAEAAREIDEELGIHVKFAQLVYRGRERAARRFPNGLIDREFHEVYILQDNRPLSSYRPDPHEVSALASFPLQELIDVAASRRESVAAMEPSGVVIKRSEMVPYSAARLRRLTVEFGAPSSR